MVATILRSQDQIKTSHFILETLRYINLINKFIMHDCEYYISTAALKTENAASTLIDVNIKSYRLMSYHPANHKQKEIFYNESKCNYH